MRLSWHPEADVVVLSLWREETCAGTFRMPHEDVGAFIDALIDNLRDAPGVHLPPRAAVDPDGLGETQLMAPPQSQAPFTEWAFGPPQQDDHANAS